MLLTRLPRYRGLLPFAFDLHVLGTPPAFVLSQDQTLQLIFGTGASTGSQTRLKISRAEHACARRLRALRSTNFSFCKAGTFYLVFKEHRTRIDRRDPRWGLVTSRFSEPIPVRSVGHHTNVLACCKRIRRLSCERSRGDRLGSQLIELMRVVSANKKKRGRRSALSMSNR